MSEQVPEIEGLGYGAALAELEQLLDELEHVDVDVDRLAEQVARGVALVRHCRTRLDVVSDEVDGVVAELMATESRRSDTDPGRDGTDPGDDDGEPADRSGQSSNSLDA